MLFSFFFLNNDNVGQDVGEDETGTPPSFQLLHLDAFRDAAVVVVFVVSAVVDDDDGGDLHGGAVDAGPAGGVHAGHVGHLLLVLESKNRMNKNQRQEQYLSSP